VATILPHTESDPVALLLQYLVSFGNATGRTPHYIVDGTAHYPNLYTILAGPTATGRKGTSANRIRRVVTIADGAWAHNSVTGGISSGEGIIDAIRDPVIGIDKKTGAPVVTDAGVADKRLLLDEREFSGALEVMRREGNIVSRIVRDAWDCPPVLRTLTKNSKIRASDPFISIIGHITIDELRAKLDRNSAANGYGNRFLYGCVRRSKILPHGGSLADEAVSELGVATQQALQAAQALQRITMTGDAAALWETLYPGLSEGQSGLFGTLTARADAQTLRLALLYALMDGAGHIERVHLEAARALWTFCAASARYIFSDFTGDPSADDILRALRNAGGAGMSRTDIYTMLHCNIASGRIGAALNKLAIEGKVRCVKTKTNGRGRPTEMWFAV
jgi:hypothetical protein